MSLDWEGATPFDPRLTFALRGAESREALGPADWQALPAASARDIRVSAPPHRWWQYGVTFGGRRAGWPTLQRVRIAFQRAQR